MRGDRPRWWAYWLNFRTLPTPVRQQRRSGFDLAWIDSDSPARTVAGSATQLRFVLVGQSDIRTVFASFLRLKLIIRSLDGRAGTSPHIGMALIPDDESHLAYGCAA
jgi:hypothetical protein